MKDDDVKLVCGHRVSRQAARIAKDGDLGWCPTCKCELFTGWPNHMEASADLARRIKDSITKYLDGCEHNGKRPTLSALVAACEGQFSAFEFNNGHRAGGAVDAD